MWVLFWVWPRFHLTTLSEEVNYPVTKCSTASDEILDDIQQMLLLMVERKDGKVHEHHGVGCLNFYEQNIISDDGIAVRALERQQCFYETMKARIQR